MDDKEIESLKQRADKATSIIRSRELLCKARRVVSTHGQFDILLENEQCTMRIRGGEGHPRYGDEPVDLGQEMALEIFQMIEMRLIDMIAQKLTEQKEI